MIVETFGKNWTFISFMLKNRTARQCKERWEYFLSPDINHREWTKEEDELLYIKKQEFRSQWTLIQNSFPTRTSASIKNRWKHLQKCENEQKLHFQEHSFNFSISNEIEQFDIESSHLDWDESNLFF
jgi:hypothetical protein